mgnify:FL=1
MEQPGLLSLVQDQGRFGQAALGLTTGGPMDPRAAQLANLLVGNAEGASLIEVSFGGLEIIAEEDCQIAVTGAALDLTIDGAEKPLWTTLDLNEGGHLRLGYSETGCRSYLALGGALALNAEFGSTSTVLREGIGGLNGQRLQPGDRLALHPAKRRERYWLPPILRPQYHHQATLRVVPGYQQHQFPRVEQRRFYGSDYEVSQRCDRMGYRLEGPAIGCDLDGILSEGIAPGAIQVPADGQPIVLLNDRQTIGGYPKLGTVLSLDCAALGQLRAGDAVTFIPISEHGAHNALHLARVYHANQRLERAPA